MVVISHMSNVYLCVLKRPSLGCSAVLKLSSHLFSCDTYSNFLLSHSLLCPSDETEFFITCFICILFNFSVTDKIIFCSQPMMSMLTPTLMLEFLQNELFNATALKGDLGRPCSVDRQLMVSQGVAMDPKRAEA